MWSRKWQPTPVFLPGKSHDRGAWQATGHSVTELDMTEWLSMSTHKCLTTAFLHKKCGDLWHLSVSAVPILLLSGWSIDTTGNIASCMHTSCSLILSLQPHCSEVT